MPSSKLCWRGFPTGTTGTITQKAGELVMTVDDGWHRRQAVAIASTLPDDIDDARKILQLSMKLLDGFLSEGSKPGSVGAVEADQPPQPQSGMLRTTKLWLCAALVLAIVVPSPIFQGNSIFASAAKADGLTSAR
jgi:hypothetical protein